MKYRDRLINWIDKITKLDDSFPQQFHYVYKLTNKETGEYYYGVRSCNRFPQNDSYKGSFKTWNVTKDELTKEILYIFSSRSLAVLTEREFIKVNITNKLNRNFQYELPLPSDKKYFKSKRTKYKSTQVG